MDLEGLGWLLLMLGPFLFVQRWMHREVQLVFWIITRKQSIALGLFALIFFPGVLLHELSHYLAARLVGVGTGRLSLLPGLMEDGKLRLGYVETESADVVRDAWIGIAPLLSGGAAVALLGIKCLGLAPLADLLALGDWLGFAEGLREVPRQPDFWLWFYLAFTISSTMLPSASDRRAWLPIGLALGLVIGAALLIGAGPWMLENLAPWLNRGFQAVATVFGISLALHLVILLPFWLLRVGLMRASGPRLARNLD